MTEVLTPNTDQYEQYDQDLLEKAAANLAVFDDLKLERCPKELLLIDFGRMVALPDNQRYLAEHFNMNDPDEWVQIRPGYFRGVIDDRPSSIVLEFKRNVPPLQNDFLPRSTSFSLAKYSATEWVTIFTTDINGLSELELKRLPYPFN